MIRYIKTSKTKYFILSFIIFSCGLFNLEYTYASSITNFYNMDISSSTAHLDEPKPYAIYIARFKVGATSYFNDATCNISLSTYPSVTSVDLHIELQQKTSSGYSTIKTWEETSTTTSYTTEISYTPRVHGTYRFSVLATAYDSSGNTEYVRLNSNEIVY